MDNKEFIFQMQNQYESLKYFIIKDNKLILNKDGTFVIPFNNVILSSLNPILFTLDPKEIFHILRMLELLQKKELTDKEKGFINQYVLRYLKLNNMALNDSNINTNLIISLNIPIYLSYDEEFQKYPGSLLIQKIIINYSENLEKNNGNSIDSQKRLVLIPKDNPNFIIEQENNYIHNFEKAGFTSLLLITSTIALTCAYIAYFILGK